MVPTVPLRSWVSLTCHLLSLGALGCSTFGAERCGASSSEPASEVQERIEAPPSAEAAPSARMAADAPPPLARSARRLALGAQHSCLLADDGRVFCWGGNRFFQLGTDEVEPSPTAARAEPRAVEGLEDVVQVTAGSFHTCALRADGAVYCFGHGGFGQLGSGRMDRARPQRVEGLGPVVEIGAGETFSCARTSDGRVVCFGRNDFGELGFEGPGREDERRAVMGVDDAEALAVGRHHACALRAGGRVSCWGMNAERQCGPGRKSAVHEVSSLPAEVPLPGPAVAIAAGGAHSCALLDDGRARCWGSNDSGQLSAEGEGDGARTRSLPLGLAKTEGSALALGGRFTCVRGNDEGVACAGFNGFGQLGDGTTASRRDFVRIPHLTRARDLAAGARHACALLTDRRVECWGKNDRLQLGDASAVDRSRPTLAMEL